MFSPDAGNLSIVPIDDVVWTEDSTVSPDQEPTIRREIQQMWSQGYVEVDLADTRHPHQDQLPRSRVELAELLQDKRLSFEPHDLRGGRLCFASTAMNCGLGRIYDYGDIGFVSVYEHDYRGSPVPILVIRETINSWVADCHASLFFYRSNEGYERAALRWWSSKMTYGLILWNHRIDTLDVESFLLGLAYDVMPAAR